jgi:hypothetical protein
VMH